MASQDEAGAQAIYALPDYAERSQQARRRAEWELGDASWAGVILAAFLNPAADAAALRRDMGE